MPPRKKARVKNNDVHVSPAQKKTDRIGFRAGSGHCVVSGASGRGKTQYVVSAALGTGVHKKYQRPKWDACIVMCDAISIGQDAYTKLANEWKGKGPVTFVEGIPSGDDQDAFLELCRQHDEDGYHTLCIVDDLMNQSSSGAHNTFINTLFTSARHYHVDVWEMNQNPTASRTRRLQAAFLICFATPSDVRSIANIARQIKPENPAPVLAAYREAVESHDGHGCLVICLNEPEEFMFRNTDMSVCFDLNSAPVNSDGKTVLGMGY